MGYLIPVLILLAIVCIVLTILLVVQYCRIHRLSEKLEDFLTGRKAPLDFSVREDAFAPLTNACAELENRLLLAQERRAEECRRTSDLTADISHQLKTPLAALKLFCEMVDSEYLPQQLSQIGRMERLIHSLLRLERLCADGYAFSFDEADLSDIIRSSWASLSPGFPGCSLSLWGESNIRCDAKWLGEAFSNLFKNACEHMPQGGTVRVKVSPNEAFCFITLEDEGGGVSAKDLPHLFERFYRAEGSPQSGAGIGLAIVREIIWHHHGSIHAENGERGLIMQLSLPRLNLVTTKEN